MATGSPVAGAVTLGVGVLLDIDHFYDYYLWYMRRIRTKLYIWLHAWELSAAAILVWAFLWHHPILLALAAGHLSHVTVDHFHNRLVGFGYFLIYRLKVRFERERIVIYDQGPYDVHWPRFLRPLSWPDRWIQSRVSRCFRARAIAKARQRRRQAG